MSVKATGNRTTRVVSYLTEKVPSSHFIVLLDEEENKRLLNVVGSGNSKVHLGPERLHHLKALKLPQRLFQLSDIHNLIIMRPLHGMWLTRL